MTLGPERGLEQRQPRSSLWSYHLRDAAQRTRRRATSEPPTLCDAQSWGGTRATTRGIEAHAQFLEEVICGDGRGDQPEEIANLVGTAWTARVIAEAGGIRSKTVGSNRLAGAGALRATEVCPASPWPARDGGEDRDERILRNDYDKA